MLGIPDLRKKVSIVLLLVSIASLVSCAHDKDNSLVSDQKRKYESTIPWNRQEQWEQDSSGQMSQLMNSR